MKTSNLVFTTFFLFCSNFIFLYAQTGGCHKELKILSPDQTTIGCTGDGSWNLIVDEHFNSSTDYLNLWQETPVDPNYSHLPLYPEPNNAFVEDGLLKLKLTNDGINGKPGRYGMICSRNMYKYGKYEIRCKIPEDNDNSVAFWMYGGPVYSEIDVFEFGISGKKNYGKEMPTNSYYNYDIDPAGHSASYSCSNNIDSDDIGVDFKNGFHTYTLIWDEWKIQWLVDGQPVRTLYQYYFPSGAGVEKEDFIPGYAYEVSKSFPNSLMNIFIQAGGNPEGTYVSDMFEIDYVKIWTKHDEFYTWTQCYKNGYSTGRLFEPITEYLCPSKFSDWADVAGGNIDSDDEGEFAVARNLDGNMWVYQLREEPNYGTGLIQFQGLAYNSNPGSSSDWKGITLGNVDNDPEDEVIAVRDFDGDIFVYDIVNGNWVQKWTFSNFGNASEWVGIEAGNFDSDPQDEIVLTRNYDSKIIMLDVNSNGDNFTIKAVNNTFGSASDFADLSVGDIDGDGKQEVVVVRNFDGNLYSLELTNGQLIVDHYYTGFGSSSDFEALTCGDFDNDDKDEIILYRNFDNSFKYMEIEAGNWVGETQECFFRAGVKGLGTFNRGTTCCEELVVLKSNGQIATFYVNKGGCSPEQFCPNIIGNIPKFKNPESNSEIENSVNIYPNPTQERIKIELPESESGNSIEIYAPSGQLIHSVQSNKLVEKFDFSEFANGMYIIRVTNDFGTTMKKVTKH